MVVILDEFKFIFNLKDDRLNKLLYSEFIDYSICDDVYSHLAKELLWYSQRPRFYWNEFRWNNRKILPDKIIIFGKIFFYYIIKER